MFLVDNGHRTIYRIGLRDLMTSTISRSTRSSTGVSSLTFHHTASTISYVDNYLVWVLAYSNELEMRICGVWWEKAIASESPLNRTIVCAFFTFQTSHMRFSLPTSRLWAKQ